MPAKKTAIKSSSKSAKTIKAAKPKSAKKPVAKAPAAKPKITKEMTLGEAVSKYPQTMEVLFRYGLHCIGCHVSAYESIEQGAIVHGLSKDQIDKMVEEMNKKI